MKRIYITFATAFIACTALTISCKKKDNIAPNKTTTTTTTTTSKGSATPESFPFDVSKMFLPTGFWSGGDGGGGTAGTVALVFTATDTLWTNSIAEFSVTNKANYGGLAFLNNNEWTPKYHFASGATKLTFDLKADVGVKIKVTAFPGVPAINKADSITSTDANAWVTKTITFTGTYPDSLTGANFASLAFTPPAGSVVNDGHVYNFAIRNMVLDK